MVKQYMNVFTIQDCKLPLPILALRYDTVMIW